MRIIKIFLLSFIVFFLIISGVFGFGLFKAHERWGKFGTQTVTVESGSGLRDIANLLKNENLIKSEQLFIFYALLDGQAKNMKAGVYEISTPISTRDLVALISGGEVAGFVRVVIPEGFNTEQIATRLTERGVLESEMDFINMAKLSTSSAYGIYDYEFLKNIQATTLEGFLFPDTYEFRVDSDVESVLGSFLSNFQHKAGGLITDYDILIMASLLEREVQTEEDMRIVAGVLNNRLEINMPLQVDATLVYITGKTTGELSNADKLIDHPFNTYQNRGLPPTPIANPGIKAINAARNPTQTNYFYYISAPDGTTYFARTLEEHNENIVKYLR